MDESSVVGWRDQHSMHILCAKLAGKDECVTQIAAAKFGLRWMKRETRLTGDFGITCCRLAAALDEIELDYVG